MRLGRLTSAGLMLAILTTLHRCIKRASVASCENTCTGDPAPVPCRRRPEKRMPLYSSTEGDAHALDDLCDLARVVALRSGVLLYPGRLHPSPAGHCGGCSRDSARPRPPDPATVAGYRASFALHRALPGGVLIWEECARDRAGGGDVHWHGAVRSTSASEGDRQD
jgi:hypothetical protein